MQNARQTPLSKTQQLDIPLRSSNSHNLQTKTPCPDNYEKADLCMVDQAGIGGGSLQVLALGKHHLGEELVIKPLEGGRPVGGRNPMGGRDPVGGRNPVRR